VLENSTKRVLRTDGSGRTVELVGRQSITEAPTSVENAMPLLDSPGEWYLDSSSHQVFYIPRSGEDLAGRRCRGGQPATLMSLQGSTSAHVHNIAFHGIQFSYATNTIPNTPTGFSEIQATYTITGTNGFAVQGLCTFRVPAARARTAPGPRCRATSACPATTTSRSTTTTSSTSAPRPGHRRRLTTRHGDRQRLTTSPATASMSVASTRTVAVGPAGRLDHRADSHFFNTSAEFHGGVAIDIGYVKNSTFAHNQIDHTPYTGISVGWGGWRTRSSCRRSRTSRTPNNFTDT